MKIRLFGFTFLLACFLMGNTSCSSDKPSSGLETGWYYIVDGKSEGAVERVLVKSENEKYYLDPNPIITKTNITAASIYTAFSNSKGIKMSIDAEGVDKWAVATELYVRKYIGFVLNDELIVVNRIAAKDNYGNTSIGRKDFDDQELEKLLNDIQALLPK